MVPLFKSSYSIGKSILTLDKSVPGGPDSIIDICLEHGLKKLILVEDSMTGFMKAFNACQNAGIHLIFGLRVNCVNSIDDEVQNSSHKVVIFAKSDAGCKALNNITSEAKSNPLEAIDCKFLNKNWSEELDLFIPFYDSFLFKNNTSLANCIPDFRAMKPSFFVERNGLPFDRMMEEIVRNYCKDKYKMVLAKSIYYKNKSDIEALQTYKILCTRNFGKPASLNRPQLDHFGSDEFSFESYLEHAKRTA
jgi:DNA polymerase III alpha subunit